MGKQIDWNSTAKVNFDDNRRKAQGLLTGKELFAKAHERLQQAEEALAQRRATEPLLRKALFDRMVTKEPIRVLVPIKNPTETIGGITKSQDEEDDGFYMAAPKVQNEMTAGGKFEEVMETIPAGTELTFKTWDKQLDQFIFKSATGQEYSIYTKNVIIFKESQIENPGLFGLLFNTDLISALGED